MELAPDASLPIRPSSSSLVEAQEEHLLAGEEAQMYREAEEERRSPQVEEEV